MFYTYAHYTTDTNELFYIGKGFGKRAREKSNRNRWWHNKVNKHGFVAKILAYWDTEEDALIHEKFLIGCFRDMGVCLVNLADGGKSNTGWKHSEETKQKMSEQRKGKAYALGYKHSVETRERMRKSQVGRKHTPETLEKMRQAQKGENNAMWGKPNLAKRRPVVCITDEKRFDSITEASNFYGVDSSKITLVCQGKRKQTGGLQFRFVE